MNALKKSPWQLIFAHTKLREKILTYSQNASVGAFEKKLVWH